MAPSESVYGEKRINIDDSKAPTMTNGIVSMTPKIE
jgi:hypothetical protein